jgi:hypothetical protein
MEGTVSDLIKEGDTNNIHIKNPITKLIDSLSSIHPIIVILSTIIIIYSLALMYGLYSFL